MLEEQRNKVAEVKNIHPEYRNVNCQRKRHLREKVDEGWKLEITWALPWRVWGEN